MICFSSSSILLCCFLYSSNFCDMICTVASSSCSAVGVTGEAPIAFSAGTSSSGSVPRASSIFCRVFRRILPSRMSGYGWKNSPCDLGVGVLIFITSVFVSMETCSTPGTVSRSFADAATEPYTSLCSLLAPSGASDTTCV